MTRQTALTAYPTLILLMWFTGLKQLITSDGIVVDASQEAR